jgi:hypothetical protein
MIPIPTTVTFLLAVLTVSLATHQRLYAQSEASVYLNSIGLEFQKIAQDMMSYTSAVNHGRSARKIEMRRTELITQVKASETTVRRMKPFNGNSTLRDSISSYFRMSHIVLTQDYAKIMDLEEIAEQSYDAMEAYMLANEKASQKVNASYLSAETEYENFAASNGIKLIQKETKLGEKLKIAGQVNDYSDRLFLLFFKSFKNESFLMEAMSREDVGAMEQTRNALLTSATDDLEKVKPLQAFKGDNALKTATQQMLNFYIAEASGKIPQVIEFYLKKEEFEKMDKAMKANRKPTQAEIDTFNKAVNEYNQRIVSMNKVNDELNKKRHSLHKALNSAREDFLHKYTPRHN